MVKQHRPAFKWIMLALVLCLLVAAFFLGQWNQNRLNQQTEIFIEGLNASIQQLEERNEELVNKNARLLGDSKVERDAYVAANESLISLQKEILVHKEELLFYRGIMAPGKSEYAVNTQEFSLTKSQAEGQYSYKLVLTKSGKSDYTVRGNVIISVEGLLDGKTHTYELKEISEVKPSAMKYSFRYFQAFVGVLQLPEKFYPETVQVRIKSKTKKVKSLENTFNWAELLSGES